MISSNYVGPGTGASTRRIDITGAAVVTQAHGKFTEAVLRGNCYTASTATAGVTVVATESVTPLPANADNPILAIYNPLGSGVRVAVLRTVIQHVSGTPAAGPVQYNYASNENITATPNNGGTAGRRPAPCLVGAASGKATAFTNTALLGGVNAMSVGRAASAHFAGAVAAATPSLTVDEVDGEIVLEPGSLLALGAPGTGTSHVVFASMTWEEIPV